VSEDLFKIDNEIEPKTGFALISEPFTDDDYFGRSVVFLTEHSKNGTLGFVLNKETEYILSDLVEDLDSTFKVYKGGPVETNSLHYIHSLGQIKDAVKINDELYWGGDFEQIKSLIKLNLIQEKQIQFFLGYSGWAQNQLEQELMQHFWIVAQVESKEIFLNQTDGFWRDKLKQMGEKFRIWLNVPENPNLN